MKRVLTLPLLGFALWLAPAVLAATARPNASKPNFIFLLADDLRWNTVGFMGDKIVRTPNLDRLAARSVVFRNHFVTTSICCVSRASILCGQYGRRHGINDFATPFTEAQWAGTYPALLRAHGYRTGFIGKFGVGNDAAVKAMAARFDYWRGLPGQAGMFFEKDDPTQTHKTARFGNQALEFLDGCAPSQPFCLSVSFNAPHARDNQPREFWPDARDEPLYTRATIPVPAKATDDWFRKLPEFVQKSEGHRRWGWRFDTPEKFQRVTKDYYRLVTGLDREVGRIVDELEKRKLAANTIIVFTSDNGFLLGERGLADKWFMYEESIRVPLLVYDPRLPRARRGKSSQALTLNIDFAPTLLELAGLRPPSTMQGRSLAPLLRGAPPGDWRTDFFYEHHTLPKIIPPSEGVRSERWKYLRWMEATPVVEELYNLVADPGEERNLIDDASQAAPLAQLRARWESLREQLK